MLLFFLNFRYFFLHFSIECWSFFLFRLKFQFMRYDPSYALQFLIPWDRSIFSLSLSIPKMLVHSIWSHRANRNIFIGSNPFLNNLCIAKHLIVVYRLERLTHSHSICTFLFSSCSTYILIALLIKYGVQGYVCSCRSYLYMCVRVVMIVAGGQWFFSIIILLLLFPFYGPWNAVRGIRMCVLVWKKNSKYHSPDRIYFMLSGLNVCIRFAFWSIWMFLCAYVNRLWCS